MPHKILQVNTNHARAAQDLFLHTLAEEDCTLGIIAEPYRIPEGHPCWISNDTASVAITWRWWEGAPICSLLTKGTHFVAAKWGGLIVMGVYLPPSASIAEYEDWLEEMADCIRGQYKLPIIVGGDFNAWNRSWGSSNTNLRGECLEEWACSLGLHLLNRGKVATCVRPQGTSIVDLTWASPSAAVKITEWKVMSEMEHLSDHRYIIMKMEERRQPKNPTHGQEIKTPRWSIRHIDEDKLKAIIITATWSHAQGEEKDPIRMEQWMRKTLTTACDASMKRIKTTKRRSAYWWSEELTELRQTAVKWGRRVHRKHSSAEHRAEIEAEYKSARQALKKGIRKAKEKAWDELLQTLQEDPWGKAYKVVLNRLRPRIPPTTQRLEPEFTQEIIERLFPPDEEENEPHIFRDGGEGTDSPDWSDDLEVNEEELMQATKRSFQGKKTAPGPDGLHKKVLALASRELQGPMINLLNNCLRKGAFPQAWRMANLVLLPKDGKDGTLPSSYRPICLLNELGKLCERVIANRVTAHLSRGENRLEPNQYGFRQGRSTLDAVNRVRSLTEAETSQGRVALAISIDIKNAFNSLPWGRIRKALREHGIPVYLQKIINTYLSDRWVIYENRTGEIVRKQLSRGVPQGSVLGPLLWNIGYNEVLRSALPPYCHVVCYADDTLILAGGDTWGEAMTRGELAASSVMRSVRKAGLEVATQKTEALFFHDGTSGHPPPRTSINLGGTQIMVGTHLKYLGLVLDGRWTYREHFAVTAKKARVRANALCRLLPNLGGPDGRVRKLYAGTVRAIVLYGAPIWAEEFASDKKGQVAIARALHPMAIRTVRAYRTVSRGVASVLAGLPPVVHVAKEYAAIFKAIREARNREMEITNTGKSRLRLHFQRRTIENWKQELAGEVAGKRLIGAIRPILDKWINRKHGGMTYRVTQILTDHGCFGKYLHGIGKEESTACHHCGSRIDTAAHTLEECPAWREERQIIQNIVGNNLSLPTLIEKMVETEEAWRSTVTFCERIMHTKEEAERERRGIPPQANVRAQRRRR